MTSPAPDDGRWLVVRNLEGRWSVAPADRPIPAGWTAEGAQRIAGPRQDGEGKG